MRRYDVYRITSPKYEDRWFSGSQVVVNETYEDRRSVGGEPGTPELHCRYSCAREARVVHLPTPAIGEVDDYPGCETRHRNPGT